METCNIFLETFLSLFFLSLFLFLFFLSKARLHSGVRAQGAGKRTVSPLCGLAATVADFWNVSQSFLSERDPVLQCHIFFFFFQSRGGCCHAPSPILAGAKKGLASTISSVQPTHLFP